MGKWWAKIVKSPMIELHLGSSQLIFKDILDEYSKSSASLKGSFHWLHYSLQLVRIEVMRIIFQSKGFVIIACSSCKEWSNEMRRTTSFKKYPSANL